MNPILSPLNEPQREATTHKEGPLLVLAGAGSGKTKLLTHRIAYLIEQGIKPYNILSVTFTNKAAKEMRIRVKNLIGESADGVWLHTFHAACIRFLRRDIEKIGYKQSFNIYDTEDQLKLLRRVLEKYGVDKQTLNGKQAQTKTIAKRYLRIFDQAKLKPRREDELCGFIDDYEEYLPKIVDVFKEYIRLMKQSNALDFNDIINFTVHIWQDHPETCKYWQRRFPYVMVDEYQDTNPAQYELLRLLTQERQNIMVVGDDDQSIYRFRGADVETVNNFHKDYSAKVIRLEQNYRSHQNVIDVANAVIMNNPNRMPKKMWTNAPQGELIEIIRPKKWEPNADDKWEAKEVCKRIKTLLRDGQYSLSDMAIIYRTNGNSRAFEEAVRRSGFNYELIGGFKFYDRKEIKDLLSYLKLLLNPDDLISFERVLALEPGFGAKSLQMVINQAFDNETSYIIGAYRWGQEGKGKARIKAMQFAQNISDIRAEAEQGIHPTAVVNLIVAKFGIKEALQAGIDDCNDNLEMLRSGSLKKLIFAETDPDKKKALKDKLKKLQRSAVKYQEDLETARERLENIVSFVSELEEYANNNIGDESLGIDEWLPSYLDSVSLNGAADKDDGREQSAITLLTGHLCKGLEFPVVFVTGLADGNFPHALSKTEDGGLEEERRLAYVAFTRAKERLFLSRPNLYVKYDQTRQKCIDSIFLDEIPVELIKGGEKKETQVGSGYLTHSQNGGHGSSNNNSMGSSSESNALSQQNYKSLQNDSTYSTRSIETMDDIEVGCEVIHSRLGMGKVTHVTKGGTPIVDILVYNMGKLVRLKGDKVSQIEEIVIR